MSTTLKSAILLLFAAGTGLLLEGLGWSTHAVIAATVLCTSAILVAISGTAARVRRQIHDRSERAANRLAVEQQAITILDRRFPLTHVVITPSSMRPSNLLVLMSLLDAADAQHIVELGCGLSTLYISSWLRDRGRGRLVSFEHDREWAARCRTSLGANGLLGYCELRSVDLSDHLSAEGHVPFYDLDGALRDIESIDVLVVDGPPAGPTCPMARFPALSSVFPKLSARCLILLDDTNRSGERRTVELWRRANPELSMQLFDTLTGCCVLRRGVLPRPGTH